MTAIPWDSLVADGVVTNDEANLFAAVVQRHPGGAWSMSGYCDLTDDQRERLEEVVITLCRPVPQ